MNIWGNNIKLSIFGESHGGGIGVIIDGLPSGVELDLDFIDREMLRRAPGRDKLSTPRNESDKPEIVSGFFDGKTTGTPLCAIIRNENTISSDYKPDLLRPGHADYTGHVKYGGFGDYRGGGHFSGRLTAPIVFAGAVAKQILTRKGITVGAHIKQIGEVSDIFFDNVNIDAKALETVSGKPFPTISDEAGTKMQDVILSAKNDLDSVGGVVECAAVGLPVGLGSPFFGSVESLISSMLFSIPAVKGIEFGAGFGFASMRGSEANDQFYTEADRIYTHTNNNSGINGGITNGMPIVFSVVLKPTPSIAKKQRTVDISKMENTFLEVHGRHDPCIVHRAVAVVEAGLALCLLDLDLG